MPAMIDTKTCTGCGRCDRSCPLDVIYYNKDEKKAEIRYPEECWMCGSCRQEHPTMVKVGKGGQKIVPIIGLDYKDKDADAMRFLRQGGDPYDFSIKDPTGEVGINFGVYGVPETFVIDKKGVIRYKQIGPITPEAWDKKIHPLINQLKTE